MTLAKTDLNLANMVMIPQGNQGDPFTVSEIKGRLGVWISQRSESIRISQPNLALRSSEWTNYSAPPNSTNILLIHVNDLAKLSTSHQVHQCLEQIVRPSSNWDEAGLGTEVYVEMNNPGYRLEVI